MREFSWMRPLLGGVSTIAIAGIVMPATVHAEAHRFHYEHVLGTTLDIVAMAPNEGSALMAANAARAEIARLDMLLSAWRTDSELASLNRTASLHASHDLFSVVKACEDWRLKTGNAFDCRMGSQVSLWTTAAHRNEMPHAVEIAANASTIAGSHIELDEAVRRISLSPAVTLSVDGLAKGYIIDAALDAARKAVPGLSGVMVNIGGDLRCWGMSPQGTCWTIGVSDPAHLEDNSAPSQILALQNLAVATSGKGLRDHIVGGNAYSHILSPQSGLPVTQIVSATVVATKAADADALATALCVLSPSEGLELVQGIDNTEALIVTTDGARHVSSGWIRLVAADSSPSFLQRAAGFIADSFISSAEAAEGGVWPSGYALTVDYEIPQVESSNYKKPYVAIWVTDADKKLVRHLTLLGNEQKWIDSNYVWWRRFGRKIPNVIESMTKPTLAPGKHSVVWDGRDDKGKPVAQGEYVIHIEATREHGGHSYLSIPLSLDSSAVAADGKSADELGATKVSYGKRE